MRVAIAGLGMAVAPHAKSLLDLKDRVEVAYAFSPSVVLQHRFRPAAEKLRDLLNCPLQTARSTRTRPFFRLVAGSPFYRSDWIRLHSITPALPVASSTSLRSERAAKPPIFTSCQTK